MVTLGSAHADGQVPVLEPTHVWDGTEGGGEPLLYGVGTVLDGEWAMVADQANSEVSPIVGAIQVYRKGADGYVFFQTIHPAPVVRWSGLWSTSLSLKGNVVTFSREPLFSLPLSPWYQTQAYVYEFNGSQWVFGGLLDPIPSPPGIDLSRHWAYYGTTVIDDTHVAYTAWGRPNGGNVNPILLPYGMQGVPAIHFYHKVGGVWVPEQLWWGEFATVGTDFFPTRLASDNGRVVAASAYHMNFGVLGRNSQGQWHVEQWMSNPFWRDWFNDPYASIAFQGDLIVFGQPFGTSEMGGLTQPRPGSVQVFRETTQGWQFEADLEASDSWWGPAGPIDWKSDRFGYSVDVDDGRIVVGALQAHIYPNEQGPDDGYGAAYVFEKEGTQWVEQYRLWAETPTREERFGNAISVQGNAVIVTNQWLTSAGNSLNAQVFYVPMGQSVCEGQSNSGGGSADLAITGFEDPNIGFLHLATTGVPTGQTVLFLAATQSGLINNPGGSQGDLCLGGSLARFNRAGEFGLADGAGSFEVNIAPSSIPVSPTRPILSGETWYFQAWYRDGASSNFSSAVGVLFE
ncbi:MAG: hypothetical protein GY934_03895 [Gammaproteobacteria bacterium]|nr:hypothetical protein [Gammaproteobacteria bacterium]